MYIQRKLYFGMLLACLSTAQMIPAQTLDSLDNAERGPVAVADDYRAAGINPAALAVGNADGVAGEFSFFSRNDVRFDLFATATFGEGSPGVGYAFGGRTSTGLNRHSLAFAFPLLDNVYIGSRYAVDNWRWEDGDASLGLLIRPASFLSIGAVGEWHDLKTVGARFGIGLRPLAVLSDADHRLTVAVDSGYDSDGFRLPSVYVGSEPVDGVRLGGHYDFEQQQFGFVLSLAAGPVHAGSRLEFKQPAQVEYGTVFAHLSWKQFPSIFTDGSDRHVEWVPGPLINDAPANGGVLFDLLGIDSGTSIVEVLDQIDTLRTSSSVRGIVIRDPHIVTSYSNFLDLREALLQFRAAGKSIIFYSAGFDNLTYALAAAVADKIYLHPQGGVDLSGFAVSRPYLKGLLDEYGVEIVVFKSHPHKSAGDSLISETMSPSERENLEGVLQSSFDQLVELVEEGRGERLRSPAAELIADGPYLQASVALEAGLVDDLLFVDELRPTITERFGGDDFGEYSFAPRYNYDWVIPSRTRVAIVYASGTIGTPIFLETAVDPDVVVAALEEAVSDPSIEGILLRIDSPGGSVLASSRIGRAVERAAQQKPLVVSMGGTAASGGYWIAAPAEHIVASPVTVTGSIGVIALVPNFAGTSEKYGVRWERVARGEQADFGAPTRQLTDLEREKVTTLIEQSYIEFRDHVARHRSLSIEEVDAAAQGRVWSGTRALELNLVDELGGLQTAVAALQERIDPSREMELVNFNANEISVFSVITSGLFGRVLGNTLPSELLSATEELRLLYSFRRDLALALSPYYFSTGLQ